jgi:ubiquinone/menaquinone biosynthesis C-methylase UbiE
LDYDRTALPDVYVEARTLATESLAVWREAIRAAVPADTGIARIVDLGCGTGRFTALLAGMFGVAVVGLDPSLRMLANRQTPAGAPTHFVAGTAEAMPVATASIDLVFLSMVYHHLRVAGAIGELGRVLRPGGRVVVRNPTRETVDSYEFLRFFPEAKAIDVARMPPREAVARAFREGGFTLACRRTVVHTFATDHRDYLRKIGLRGLSSLQAISDEEFERGLAAFARHCRAVEDDRPVTEPTDLFVFVRSPDSGATVQ